MKIKLTASSGVLIEMDGVRILLDGVCEKTEYYLGTPDEIKRELSDPFPDAVGFTHLHSDHYDESYADLYCNKTLRSILGSECSLLKVGNVSIHTIPTRHLGKCDTEHYSFIIEGSRRIFFMGDASPTELRRLSQYGRPDVLISPFAYFNTESSLKMTRSVGADVMLLVHMPDKNNDPYKIWESVENTIKGEKIRYFTKIGDTITLQ